ncbi:MAG: TolC family protein [Phycisphaerae bacterium]|nr:TolC family protein [Phycisphaerae bacterium]
MPAARPQLLLLLALLPACASMQDIDRRVNRTVRDRSETLGGGAASPTLRSTLTTSSPTQYDKRPASNNPGPDELTYRGADPSRDVFTRLESYFAEGTTQGVAHRFDLQDILRVSQDTAREYRTAEEDYLLTAIRLLIEQHRWGPRFFDDVTTSVNADAMNGDYSTALNVINELRATQRLPYGGELEARLITTAVNQLTEIVGEQYTQSSQLVLGASVPLLRNAGLVAQEDIIQAERDTVYAARDFENFRRRFFVDIASDYFALIARQAAIRNQAERLKSVALFYEQTKALVEAGRQPPFEARNIEQNVLSSRNDLINSQEAYILSLDQFKVRLGIPVETQIVLLPMSLDFQDPDVSVTEAAELALLYRLDFQNERDRVDDARRQIEIARNRLLPDLNLTARATLNTDENKSESGLAFKADQTDYAGSITFGLPLDREIERLELRQSLVQLERQIRQAEQFRDNLILEARQSVREIDRARFSVRLQEQTVKINELRLEEIQIKRAEVDAQKRLDAENELLQARNALDAAVRDLRIAILEYLVRTGQLRVSDEGRLRALRGMDLRVEAIEDAPMTNSPSPANPPQSDENNTESPDSTQPGPQESAQPR